MYVILMMLFLHIVDDYYMQGFLAQLKQRKWYLENYPQELYKHDYICALITHGFSWAFMVMLPLAIISDFKVDLSFVIVLVTNSLIHSYIDHLKANKGILSLCQDQCLHIIQILLTFVWFFK